MEDHLLMDHLRASGQAGFTLDELMARLGFEIPTTDDLDRTPTADLLRYRKVRGDLRVALLRHCSEGRVRAVSDGDEMRFRIFLG